VHTPYTSNFVDAYAAAHGSIAVAVSAVLWGQRNRPLASRIVLQAGVLTCAVAPMLPLFLAGLGVHTTATTTQTILDSVALFGTLGVLLSARLWPIVWAVVGEIVLRYLVRHLTSSDLELTSLHLAWLGLLVGLHRRDVLPREPAAPDDHRRDDVGLFMLGTLAAAFVGFVVLQRKIGSADEWAYTYQAAVFAKLRAYANEPACSPAFQSFWVFPYMGRQFSQYTPGWPFFMVPFVWLGVPWLAGSFAFGGLVAGFARLGRRAMTLADEGASRLAVRTAGIAAALVASTSSTMLINGGSRFSHVFVLALYVWTVEALFVLADPVRRPTRDEEARWATVVGAGAALLLATRPVDGAGLGIGLFVYFVYALVRRRISARAILAIAVPFALIGGLTLVILRLQMGKWFETAYALNSIVHPWNKFKLVTPTASQWRWGFPLATGSYGWWPCSFAVGFAGLASLGKRGRALNTVLFLGVAPVMTFYAFLNLGRGYDWGYGPRYQMVAMVPMAIGAGVAMARLFAERAHRAAFGAALAAMVAGVVRIAPLVYPYEYAAVTNENRVQQAIEDAHIHDALVIASPGTGAIEPEDMTQNLPLDLYPRQDVIIAVPRTPHLAECVRVSYPNRTVYIATGSHTVVLQRVR
jgi:hypothetical protein